VPVGHPVVDARRDFVHGGGLMVEVLADGVCSSLRDSRRRGSASYNSSMSVVTFV
jgi:hypothetical protein